MQDHGVSPYSIEGDIRAMHLKNHLNEGVLLPPPVPVGGRLSQFVCGGLETYNERSLRPKYCISGVPTSFYEFIPATQVPMGDIIPQGPKKASAFARDY